MIKLKEIAYEKVDVSINKKEINTNYQVMEKKHFSKEGNKVLDIDSVKAMQYGTKVHEMLEYADFKNKNNKYLSKLFTKIKDDYINVYREYEFKYQKDNTIYNGVIDLMLEYDTYINIVDYKLKNIDDENYLKQLKGYKEYIESISSKKVFIYLYSIMDDKLKEIDALE